MSETFDIIVPPAQKIDYYCLVIIKNQVSRAFYSFNNLLIVTQLLHVYAKNYENNGKVILIRIVRYSLDGQWILILCLDFQH